MKRFVLIMLASIVAISICGASASSAADRPFRYLSPRPGARYVSPKTCLLFRKGEILKNREIPWKTAIRVEGSISGLHQGKWVRSDDSRTIIFHPDHEFELGETVTVSFNLQDSQGNTPYSHHFRIKERIVTDPPEIFDDYYEDDPLSGQSERAITGYHIDRDAIKKRYQENNTYIPPPDFPNANITVCDNPADGRIFLANKRARWIDNPTYYLMILNNEGFPLFFRRTVTPGNDFKKQANGMITYALRHTFHFYVMDNTYTVVDSFTALNDLKLDFHDFIMLDNGNVLLIAKEFDIIDMGELIEDGQPNVKLVSNVVQEIDPSRNLVFQWRTIDHFDILDTNIDLTRRRVDYAHINAVEVDYDGNLLISSRNMSEVTKINRETGEVMWRLGGPNNDFELANDTQWFSRQHDIRRISNGNVTVYDNGNLNVPQNSRAAEYSLDMENMVATRVWSYSYDPSIYVGTQGNAQRLPNGNTLIGWGSSWQDDYPEAVEVRPDGSKAFELFLDNTAYSYRVYRFPWKGRAAEPYAWPDTTGGQISLHFAKFGDNRVAEFHAYRGEDQEPSFKFAAISGHSVPVHDFTAGEAVYFRVKSLDRRGKESGFSNLIKIVPNFTESLDDVEAVVRIAPSTLALSSHGKWITALISFPADCEYNAEDIEECSIMLNDSVLVDWTGEAQQNEETGLMELMAKFSREAVVRSISESGTAVIKISGYLPGARFEGYDSIRINDRELAVNEGRETLVRKSRSAAAALSNYPNPFNPETVISYSISSAGPVNLSVYDVSGKLVTTLVDRRVAGGNHTVRWNGTNSSGSEMASGIYFYRLRTPAETITRKMILLR